MRTDPTDNGGLFIGRRPGTKPVRYRALPTLGSLRRQMADRTFAVVLLVTMALINVSFWGPVPMGWLWVGSHVEYWTGSVSVGILSAFVGLLATLLIALVALKRLDHAWILVRRAGGHDQRQGTLGRIFVATCAVTVPCFVGWLLLFAGADLAPLGISL
ncbi:MAG: hypothetical protein QOK31_1542 [Solirubrobacteraceae bacterium]|jgi:hypothetical protein|nr:hypothetical protein [Solirubrobacteraceae bacterium]